MATDLLDSYSRASAWTLTKVADAADRLDAETPCDGWDVRTLMNHMLETQRYFLSAARGVDAEPPGAEPPELLGPDPLADFAGGRSRTLESFGAPGVIEKAGSSLAIAFSDQLLHGWDLAVATDQDATMPPDLAAQAFETIHGRFTEDQRRGVFKPEIEVGDDASPQEKLLAYTGRDPGR